MRIRASSSAAAAAITLLLYSVVRGAELMFIWFVQPTRFEVRLIGQTMLAAALGCMIYLWLNLRATRATLTELERARIVLDTQLTLAGEIQQRLLPEIPAHANGARWAGRLEPAGMIGGDFYEFIALDGDCVLVVVGDVSGKGIPAALLQTSAHALFRTFARETPHPADLLARVSREIYAENGGAPYLTCIVLRLDGAKRSLTYANAGHPAGLLLGSSGRRLLSAGGPPAGLFPETPYESECVTATPGDLGVFVTDGITEALEQEGTPAADTLNASLCAVPAPRTPDRVCDALMDLARHSAGPAGVSGWQDDRTVLAFVVDLEATIRR
jgi:sigma-B regulation protein RsbU (phosphoserine phosphatase)